MPQASRILPKPPPLPPEILKKLRALVQASPWRKATSAPFRDAPHSYVIFFWAKRPWKFFAHKIRKYGVYRTWRGHRYKYLVLDNEVFLAGPQSRGREHARPMN